MLVEGGEAELVVLLFLLGLSLGLWVVVMLATVLIDGWREREGRVTWSMISRTSWRVSPCRARVGRGRASDPTKSPSSSESESWGELRRKPKSVVRRSEPVIAAALGAGAAPDAKL